MNPKTRGDLLSTDLDDELVIYDPINFNAHNLNKTSKLVLTHCDGEHSEDDLAKMIETELKVEDGADLAKLALKQLNQKGLLVADSLPKKPTITRRQALAMARRAGLTIALVPVIQSIVVPPPATASSNASDAGDCCGEHGYWNCSSYPGYLTPVPDPLSGCGNATLTLGSGPRTSRSSACGDGVLVTRSNCVYGAAWVPYYVTSNPNNCPLEDLALCFGLEVC